MKEVLLKIFTELDQRIEKENKELMSSGSPSIPPAEVKLLGQMSLLAQPELTMKLELAATGDLDAKLRCEYFVKKELKEILPKYNLTYDTDSDLIFIPKKSKFHSMGEFKNLIVSVIDPESALVSKAVKAPAKNKILIRSAIASGDYPKLVERILDEGGNLEDFA